MHPGSNPPPRAAAWMHPPDATPPPGLRLNVVVNPSCPSNGPGVRGFPLKKPECVGHLKGAGDLQSIELMFFLPVVDTLNVAAGQSKLSSQSVWGALRGLETFSE